MDKLYIRAPSEALTFLIKTVLLLFSCSVSEKVRCLFFDCYRFCCVSCILLLCLFKFALCLFSSTQATSTHLLARHPSTILDILAHQDPVVFNPIWYHCSCWFGLSRTCSSQCSRKRKVWILIRGALVDLLTSAALTLGVHKC